MNRHARAWRVHDRKRARVRAFCQKQHNKIAEEWTCLIAVATFGQQHCTVHLAKAYLGGKHCLQHNVNAGGLLMILLFLFNSMKVYMYFEV